MNIHSGLLAGSLLLAPAWISMRAQALFTADFQSGLIPAEISVKNEGELPAEIGYRRGYTTDGWTVDRVDTKGYAAISPTFTRDKASRNILTLPALKPEGNTVLRWQAESVYADFPDCLSVELFYPSSGEKVTGLSIEKVPSEWTTYLLPLPRTGEEVEISFITGEKPGYLLAIDDIFVGTPDSPLLDVTGIPASFYGKTELKDPNGNEGTIAVACNIFNAGAPLENPDFRWKIGDTEVEGAAPDHIATGETFTVTGEIRATIDSPAEYTLAFGSGENEVKLHSGTIFVSDYKRCLLVDEATGMWCNNCPEGSLNLVELRRTFGNDVATLVTHTGDPLEEPDYWSSLKFYAIPYFKLNRIKESSYSSLQNFPQYYREPTRFDIEIASGEESDNGVLEVTVKAAASENADVTVDTYGIGYVVTGNFSGDTEWYQKNNATRSTSGAYYFLPTNIPWQLLKYHDVTLTSEFAFTPLPDMLPAGLGPEGCERHFSITKPNRLGDWKDGFLTVFILDKTSGIVMNARKLPVASLPGHSSVPQISDTDSGLHLLPHADGTVTVSSETGGDVRIEIIGTDGRIHTSRRVSLSPGEHHILRNETPGIAIVRASDSNGSAVCKIFR